jgi:hypothetical protein
MFEQLFLQGKQKKPQSFENPAADADIYPIKLT